MVATRPQAMIEPIAVTVGNAVNAVIEETVVIVLDVADPVAQVAGGATVAGQVATVRVEAIVGVVQDEGLA